MRGIRKGTGAFVVTIGMASCGYEDSFVRTDGSADAHAIGVAASAIATAEVGCRPAETLRELAACIRDTMPKSGSEGYVAPSATALTELRAAVSRMLNGHCDFALGANIAPVMDLRTFRDVENGKAYCVLMEVRDANGDGVVDRGWGTFIVDPTASRELSHQAPHPLADVDTELQAIDIFKRTDSRSFLLCGAHRNANAAQACDADYRKADCAHDAGGMFYAASREISAFYGSRRHHQVQWHGMGTDTCPDVTVYISPGLASAPAADALVRTLDAEAEATNPTWSVKMPGSGTCGLNATDNVEGRFLNGVTTDMVCNTAATTASGAFIHVEQKREARDPLLWLTPVTRTFPIPDPTPPTSLAAAASPGRITLSWVASNGASRYEVRRGLAIGGPYNVVATVSATSWVDTSVVSRTRYFYVVAAANSRGTSAPSGSATARAF
ncbi:fibronectin type III domain-containing protein [Polyangium sp. y55x31]|uniref:fibronectin type III domain-containing protein n=1 Tax=Polyangium sp. y55x31 TaxID=3042688 RepID=UPI00248237DC|nr:fibronectin type III domain-containing protein [Polyangium sp. y55x31]MDI1477672.1 fibronectin type III domain-containing protein [Polyangium sp. y55x31]